MVNIGPFSPDRWGIQTRVWSGPFCRLVLYEIYTSCENFIVQITALASLLLFIGRTVTILPGKTLKKSHKCCWLLLVVFYLHTAFIGFQLYIINWVLLILSNLFFVTDAYVFSLIDRFQKHWAGRLIQIPSENQLFHWKLTCFCMTITQLWLKIHQNGHASRTKKPQEMVLESSWQNVDQW